VLVGASALAETHESAGDARHSAELLVSAALAAI